MRLLAVSPENGKQINLKNHLTEQLVGLFSNYGTHMRRRVEYVDALHRQIKDADVPFVVAGIASVLRECDSLPAVNTFLAHVRNSRKHHRLDVRFSNKKEQCSCHDGWVPFLLWQGKISVPRYLSRTVSYKAPDGSMKTREQKEPNPDGVGAFTFLEEQVRKCSLCNGGGAHPSGPWYELLLVRDRGTWEEHRGSVAAMVAQWEHLVSACDRFFDVNANCLNFRAKWPQDKAHMLVSLIKRGLVPYDLHPEAGLLSPDGGLQGGRS